jgi:osmotically-inducible protein OsmY
LSLLALLGGGCASVPLIAALDVMNVAETGKTGYDMATGLNERRSLEQETSPDFQAEARLRAALEAQGGTLRYAVPLVCQGRGYVVGTYATPEELARARRATASIHGLKSLTLCLYPAGSGPASGVSDGELRDNILRMSGLRTRDVRVHVVEGNAVLVGRVRTRAERDRLLSCARDAGAASIRDYVQLAAGH